MADQNLYNDSMRQVDANYNEVYQTQEQFRNSYSKSASSIFEVYCNNSKQAADYANVFYLMGKNDLCKIRLIFAKFLTSCGLVASLSENAEIRSICTYIEGLTVQILPEDAQILHNRSRQFELYEETKAARSAASQNYTRMNNVMQQLQKNVDAIKKIYQQVNNPITKDCTMEDMVNFNNSLQQVTTLFCEINISVMEIKNISIEMHELVSLFNNNLTSVNNMHTEIKQLLNR